MTTENNIYRKVVGISYEYLGPASERFINRQISTHLNKRPEAITLSDLDELLGWLRLTFAHLTNDEELVNSYIEDLQSLSDSDQG